jgi:hypothetical protein
VTVIHGSTYKVFDSPLNPAHIRGKYLGTNNLHDSHWPLVPGPGEFDVILANPPYLPLKYEEGATFGSGGMGMRGEDITIKIVVWY